MKTTTRRVTTLEIEGIEVELEFTPEYYDLKVSQPTPDTLVVGYLMYDQDCENPMTSCDCEGKLYTNPSRMAYDSSITDDRAAPGYLGLAEFGGSRDDPEYDLEADGIDNRVGEMLMAKIKADPELVTWITSVTMETGNSPKQIVAGLVDIIQGYGGNARDGWALDEEHAEKVAELGDYETLAKTAWEELYNEGKIGEYLAVPVNYCGSNHGPGTASAHTTSLDNANAVWVPDKCTIENMNFKDCVTYLDKLAVADKYASGVLSSYVMWANGECYGVVVETFKLEGDTYVRTESDLCWGCIGGDYGDVMLKEQMEDAASKFKEEVTA